jgi:hypothetical protein
MGRDGAETVGRHAGVGNCEVPSVTSSAESSVARPLREIGDFARQLGQALAIRLMHNGDDQAFLERHSDSEVDVRQQDDVLAL